MKRVVGQNIAEIFVVVGWDNSFEVIESPFGEDMNPIANVGDQTVFSLSLDATVLDQYPTLESVEHIPSGLQYLCFPLGLSIKDVPLPPQFHSFIHTSQDGSRLIGSVLTFYEELIDEQRDILVSHGFSISDHPHLFVQKGICLLSHWPFLSAFKKFLTGLYQISLSPSFVPIERYICNFIDDIPAPTSGKVDITYFLEDEAIQFQCPPLNEPNAWSGFPLFPLFECLSAINIVTLFGLMFVERPIVFVSSQYSLLTLCCEAMTSLLYPFRWAHSYVPILPSKLIGILSAPVPCIFGVHSDVYQQNASLVSPEIVKVFLDDNRIDCGELGPPPKFPEGRYRKLINAIIQNVSWLTKTGDLAYTNQLWKIERLSLFDDALTDVTNNPMDAFWRPTLGGRPFSMNTNASKAVANERLPANSRKAGNALNAAARIAHPRASIRESTVNDQAIREGFLKFFVAMLKDYKRFLIYTDVTDNSPGMHAVQERFRFDDFIREQPSEWRPLLDTLKDLQAFSNFLDDRIALNKLDRDVIFFDESIEAKLNRYTFRSKNFDTPFLTYEKDKHIKTYVPPSPYRVDLLGSDEIFASGPTFPRLQAKWFINPRNVAAKFPAPKDQVLSMLCRIRLKRKWTSSSSASRSDHLSGASCIYSSYLVISSLLISHAVEQTLQLIQRQQTPSLSALDVLQEEIRHNSTAHTSYGTVHSSGGNDGSRNRRKSEERLTARLSSASFSAADDETVSTTEERKSPTTKSSKVGGTSTVGGVSDIVQEKHKVKESAVIALLVAMEILSSLTRGGHSPDEITYRLLAEACADLGRPWNLLDLIVFMDELDFIPDHQIRMALVRSINREKQLRSWTMSDADTNQDAVSARNGSGSGNDSGSGTISVDSQVKPITREIRSDTSISARSDPGAFGGNGNGSGKLPSTSSSALDRMAAPVVASSVIALESSESTSARTNIVRRYSGTNAALEQQLPVLATAQAIPSTPGRSTSTRPQKPAERPFPLTPAEVWTFQNWHSLQRPDTTVVLRSTVFGGNTGHSGRSEDVFSKFFFGAGPQSPTPFSPAAPSIPGGFVFQSPPVQTTAVSVGPVTSNGVSSSSSHRGVQTPSRSTPVTAVAGVVSPSSSNNILPPGTITTTVNAQNNASSIRNNGTTSGNPVITRGPLTGPAFEGYIPRLFWAVSEKDQVLSPRHVYATSPKLQRQVRLGETILCAQYPELVIDFASDHGMKCPNLSCPCTRVLTIPEIYQGWSQAVHESISSLNGNSSTTSANSSATASHHATNTATATAVAAASVAASAVASILSSNGSAGDYANRYTCRCVYCGTDFIPRFAVRSTATDWEGSDGPNSTLWCEFLSPWTLHKEVLNIIFEHGVNELLSKQFRSSSHQRAVVFWNLVVAFRLRGLPIAILLTDMNIKESFPPK